MSRKKLPYNPNALTGVSDFHTGKELTVAQWVDIELKNLAMEFLERHGVVPDKELLGMWQGRLIKAYTTGQITTLSFK